MAVSFQPVAANIGRPLRGHRGTRASSHLTGNTWSTQYTKLPDAFLLQY